MKRAIIAATAAALISGTVATYAANTGAATNPASGRWQPSAEDRAVLTDARISALKSVLKLTPDQEKLWPGVEQALKDVAKDRAARRDEMRTQREAARAAREAGTPADPIARMRASADRMSAGATDLRKIADAADPLYKTLDTAQKQRLNVLLRQDFRGMSGPHHRGDGPRRG